MGLLVPRRLARSLSETPQLRPEVARVIQDHFAQYGRSCDVEWVKHLNAWVGMVSLKPTDPLLGAFRAGRAGGERVPTEDVIFHEPNPKARQPIRNALGVLEGFERPYVAIDLNARGVEWVKQWLEARDTWSGRGQFRSLVDATKYARDQGVQGVAKLRETKKQEATDRAMDRRRQDFKIPYHRVGIDLTEPPRDAAATTGESD